MLWREREDPHVGRRAARSATTTSRDMPRAHTIDGKIDGGSRVTLKAAGRILIGVVGGGGDKKIDGGSVVDATAVAGNSLRDNNTRGGLVMFTNAARAVVR